MGDASTKHQRLRSIDVFKGFAIIAIVFVHLILLEPVIDGQVKDESMVKSIIIEFFYVGLLIFFAISGYFYRPEDRFTKKVLRRLLKLIFAFVLCMLVLTTILYLYLLVLGYDISTDAFTDALVNGFLGGEGAFQPYMNQTSNDVSACGIYAGYYYIEVLVLSTLLYYAIARYAMKDNVCSAVIIIALLTASMFCVEVIGFKLPYYMELVPVATAMMLIGTIARKYEIVETMENNTFDKKVVIAVLVCLVLGLLLCASPLKSDLGFHTSHFGLFGGFSAYTIFIIAVICGFVHLYLATLVSKIPYFSQIFVFVGKYSLEILLLSTFYCKILMAPFVTLVATTTYPYLDLGQVFLFGSLSIVLSIITAIVIRKIFSSEKKVETPTVAQ